MISALSAPTCWLIVGCDEYEVQPENSIAMLITVNPFAINRCMLGFHPGYSWSRVLSFDTLAKFKRLVYRHFA